jgi:hypothetical protein
MDLTALDHALDARPHCLILLSTGADDAVRRALWTTLARCESLYWIGALADKPDVVGPARCWLVECDADLRASSLRSVLRRDAHAIHVIGAADGELFALLTQAALTGSVVVAELDAGEPVALRDRAAALSEAPYLLEATLVAAIGVDDLRLEPAPPAAR